MNLEQAVEISKGLAGSLHKMDVAPCTEAERNQMSCIMKEESRPLDAIERKGGYFRRPFDCYRPTQMCSGCRSYWFAQMAFITLERVKYLQDVAKAESEQAAHKDAAQGKEDNAS